MSAQIPEKFNERIETSAYVWFTTVRADGMPQPTPVWYARDGDTFLIYTTPGSQKVNNIRANSKVALGWSNEDAGEYVVVMGEASFNEGTPAPSKNAFYFGKYREGITEIGMTPESFDATFTLPIRVTPTHVRGEVY